MAKPGEPLQSVISGFTTSSDVSKLKGYVFMACANGEPLNGEGFCLCRTFLCRT
ncbi:hypothetical protein Q5M85_05725 [Paraclostridium bifermentans]|nr:hypothetical protein [Paraclostridium bifermentans]